MCPHLHDEKGQLIQSCLFNSFNNNKIHFLVCHNTSNPPVLCMCSHYVPLIFLNAKNKATGKHKLPSHSTNNLKPKKKLKPCGQSSIKAFYKGLPGKKGKSSIITSTVANKYAVVRSFDSSSFVGCSVNSSFVTKNFDFYSELVFPRLEMKVLQKKFLLIN